MTWTLRAGAVVAAALLAACGGNAGSSNDSGTPGQDAGTHPVDAGSSTDGGTAGQDGGSPFRAGIQYNGSIAFKKGTP